MFDAIVGVGRGIEVISKEALHLFELGMSIVVEVGPRHAEIDEVQLAAFRTQTQAKIAGLQIAVQQCLAVDVLQNRDHLFCEEENCLQGQLAAPGSHYSV